MGGNLHESAQETINRLSHISYIKYFRTFYCVTLTLMKRQTSASSTRLSSSKSVEPGLGGLFDSIYVQNEGFIELINY